MPFGIFNRKRTGTASAFLSSKKDAVAQNLPSAMETPNPVRNDGTTARKETDAAQAIDDSAAADHKAKTLTADDPEPTTTTNPIGKKQQVQIRTATSSAAPNSHFTRFWNLYSDYKFIHVESSDPIARFVPNALPLIMLLNQALDLIASSSWLQKNEMRFNPYAVLTGYCYMYFIQILRAKKASSDLQGRDASALSRFEKFIKLSTVPVPAFLVPYFETIVSTQLEDAKYEWISPSFGDLSDLSTFARFGENTSQLLGLIRPPMPVMLAFLAQIGAQPQTEYAAHLSSDSEWNPIDLDRTAGQTTRLFGSDIDFSVNNAASNPARILLQCGISADVRFPNDNVWQAIKSQARSEFYGEKLSAQTANVKTTGIDVIITPNNAAGNAIPIPRSRGGAAATNHFLETKDARSIDAFLFLEKEKNPRWFVYLKDQMEMFSQFFTDVKTFEDISSTGGMTSSVLSELRTVQAHAGHYQFPNVNLGHYPNTIDWRNDDLNSLAVYHRATRADIPREDQLQALAFAPNALPPVREVITTAASAQLFRSGSYFDDMVTQVNQYEVGVSGDHPGAYQLYQGWKTDIIRPTYTAKPNAQIIGNE
jgi:hypothetical protein